jgi:hypothetical protein
MRVAKVIQASLGSTEHTLDKKHRVTPAVKPKPAGHTFPWASPPKAKRKRQAPHQPRVLQRKPAQVLIKLLIP